jgi:hypothetical protein
MAGAGASARKFWEVLYGVGAFMFVLRVVRVGHVPLDDEPARSPVMAGSSVRRASVRTIGGHFRE